MKLFKLQSLEVTEDKILNLCRFFEEYGSGMATGFKQVQNMLNVTLKDLLDHQIASV